jgi:hypothetical protein
MPLEGQHIGHYHLLHRLSESEDYAAYRAEDTHSSTQGGAKEVIIELLKLNDSGHHDAKARGKIRSGRIKERLQAIRRSNQRHIAPIYEVEEAQIHGTRYLYVATPFYQDGSLEDWWRARSKTGSLPRQDVDYIMQQATAAVQQLHSFGVAHQKLKLSSFLIQTGENPDRPVVVLADDLLALLRSDELVEDKAQRAEATAKDQVALKEMEKLLSTPSSEPALKSATRQETEILSGEELESLLRGIMKRLKAAGEENERFLRELHEREEERERLLAEMREQREEESKRLRAADEEKERLLESGYTSSCRRRKKKRRETLHS